MRSLRVVVLFVLFTEFLLIFEGNGSTDAKARKAFMVRKHLKRLKKQEGAIKLVGGRAEFEGKLKCVAKKNANQGMEFLSDGNF